MLDEGLNLMSEFGCDTKRVTDQGSTGGYLSYFLSNLKDHKVL